jgi:hypothetical protein
VRTPEPPAFFEIFPLSLNRQGEELCGDQVKVLRLPGRTIVVLSDGLGSGVKASILARLTTEIIVTMFREEAALQDVVETVVGTLPMCRVRKIAYATFVVLEIQHATGRFKLVNFDSPAPVHLHRGRVTELTRRPLTIEGRTIEITEGALERGDFLGLLSDGVIYAGMGVNLNFGWGRDEVATYLEAAARTQPFSAEPLVRSVMQKTEALYGGEPGDDATFVGILVRNASRLKVFTGPPLDPADDERVVQRLLDFDGRKVVCGGTTANIVACQTGEAIDVDLTTLREELPPIGYIPGVDLVTEGILTLTRTIELLGETGGDPRRLPADRNGAVLLTRELLHADSIHVLAGEMVNPYYQNPLLPKSVSIRRHLLERLTDLLNRFHKQVTVEWC